MSWFNWLRRPSPSTTSDEHLTDPDEVQAEQAGTVEEPQTEAEQAAAEQTPPPDTVADTPNPIRVDAVALWTAYRENQVAAEDHYGNRTLELEGEVNRVDRDHRGRIRVHFKVSDYYTLQALYAETARATVAEMRPGARVCFAARVVGADSGYVVVEPVVTET
ncbi:MAG: hypothetical protein ABIO70_14685 [Pseudomonadota bacterium]